MTAPPLPGTAWVARQERVAQRVARLVPSGLRLAAVMLACLLLVACEAGGAGGPAGTSVGQPGAPLRARLLGALPDDSVDRGVYVIDPTRAGPEAPASLLDPLIGSLVADADLLVETAAPPVTLLAGVPSSQELPIGARRVEDLVVIGRPADVAIVERRLADRAEPHEAHRALAAAAAPVGWSGPLPRLHRQDDVGLGEGRVTLTRDGDRVTLLVTSGVPVNTAAEVVRRRLADGSPPGSPGRPWRALFADPRVVVEGREVRVEARAGALDGGVLRTLLDGQGLSFLSV